MDGALGAASPAPLARADLWLLRPPSAAVEAAVWAQVCAMALDAMEQRERSAYKQGRDGARPDGPLGALGGRGGDCSCPGHGGAGGLSPGRRGRSGAPRGGTLLVLR
eukprot:92109-Chlamydomonas_euryale.AAC.1